MLVSWLMCYVIEIPINTGNIPLAKHCVHDHNLKRSTKMFRCLPYSYAGFAHSFSGIDDGGGVRPFGHYSMLHPMVRLGNMPKKHSCTIPLAR